MSTPTPGISSLTDRPAPTTLTRTGSSSLGKDQFLQLLVAQLANQDPTQPQDTSAFVSQLAQFSALEQQQNTVNSLNSLLMGQATANQTSAATFIGKDVTFNGGAVHFDGTNPATAISSLASAADKVDVSITDGSGRVVRTLQLGAQKAGDVAISWDGRDDRGNLVPPSDYTFQPAATDAKGNPIQISVSTAGTVTGVAFQGGVPVLKVGGDFIKMSDVTSINERNTP